MDINSSTQESGDAPTFPAPDQLCPCVERMVTLTDYFESLAFSSVFVLAPIYVWIERPALDGNLESLFSSDPFITQPSRNVLYCRWLC